MTNATRIDVNANLFRITYTAVSTDETRPHINGVHVEPHPDGGVVLVATDGHRMVVIRDYSGSIDGPPAIVRLDKPVLAVCKHEVTPRNPAPRLILDGSQVTVRNDVTGQSTIQFNAVIDGTFPDWRRDADEVVDMFVHDD